MNNGANIVYLGSTELIRQSNDVVMTNEYNRSELSRRYAIRKTKKETATSTLVRGYRAPEFANLYLLNPPVETTTETFAFYDCTFSGILEQNEGGNGPLYERVERPQNIASISSSIIYLQPVYRFFYTMPADSEPRVFTRTLTRPDIVPARDNTTGDRINYSGSLFFWEPYDLQRVNFDKYDEVIESWRLTFIAS
jgi:hypothetical protein